MKRSTLIVFIQIILTGIVFYPYLSNDILFSDVYDGLKNYFTFHSYLTQSEDTALLFYDRMNYPFGESIYYTDNTPFFAVLLKLFSTYIYDITSHSILIFNAFCVLGIVLSSYFTSRILQYFIENKWLIIGFSLLLPWFCPQITKLHIGHYNLSFSWVLLAMMYSLLQLHQTLFIHRKKAIQWAIALTALMILTAFIHLYYLPMMGVFMGVFVAFWMLKTLKESGYTISAKTYQQASLFILPIIAVVVVLMTVRMTDLFYAERTATGYNWSVWNFKIDALYSAYDFTTLPFLVSTSLDLHFESWGYLGGFALYGGLLFFISWLLLNNRKERFLQYFNTSKGHLVALLLVAGLVNLIIAFGDYAKMFNDGLSFDNVFSPFFYLSKLSEDATQFRVLARFNWTFFWTANFLIIYVLDQFLQKKRMLWQYGLVGLVSLIAVFDATDFMRLYSNLGKPKNVLSAKNYFPSVKALTKNIDSDKYQAILPIPFFTAGSSKMENTILSSIDWNHKNYQMSLATGLPMIPCFLSRSIDEQHRQLMTLFTEQPDNQLLEHFNDKPVLVYYSKQDADWAIPIENEIAKSYRDFGRTMPERYKMKLLAQSEKWYLYEWNLRND